MVRFDARLLSILVQYVVDHFSELDPQRLRTALKAVSTPQALLVVLEFAKEASRESELAYFVNYVGAGFNKLRPQAQYFIDSGVPGNRTSQRRLGRNLRAFARWGFIGSERPTANAFTKQTVGRYDARTRAVILNDLLKANPSVSLAEYLNAVDESISRQQALQDLKRHKGLKVRGSGRGARWHAV